MSLPACCEEFFNEAVKAHNRCAAWESPEIQNYWKHLKSHDKSHTGNGTYNGPFAYTLTKSDKDALTVGEMIKAAQKLMSQKSCPVIKYAWWLEYKGDDQSHPHIHGMYMTKTGGRIEAKHFKRAWPIWDEKIRMGAGFRGGYHRPVRHEECYEEYIAKDGGVGESLLQPTPPDQ